MSIFVSNSRNKNFVHHPEWMIAVGRRPDYKMTKLIDKHVYLSSRFAYRLTEFRALFLFFIYFPPLLSGLEWSRKTADRAHRSAHSSYAGADWARLLTYKFTFAKMMGPNKKINKSKNIDEDGSIKCASGGMFQFFWHFGCSRLRWWSTAREWGGSRKCTKLICQP